MPMKARTKHRSQKAKESKAPHRTPLLTPPKLTVPRPTRIFPRQRLFDLLDRTRKDHRVIWISAPGGAGKTSLATSYLGARKLPVLWYQVDAGDGDIASFFYYIGLAVQHVAPHHKKPLPHLTPEYLADVPTFTRNFFRELYRRLPRNSTIVLDNYQDAPEDSPLHDVLHIAMGEVPAGLNLFVLSRVEPPAVLARLRLCDHAACLDWDKLQLTPEETQGIGTLRSGDRPLDADTLRQLHDRTQGWAAGVVLMLEQSRAGGSFDTDKVPAGQKLLFDYFAGEILNRSETPIREFLLKTALLPKITVTAARALTGADAAELILDDLTRRNYFTVRHAGQPEDTYQYHPLFREFLLKGAEGRYRADQLNELRRNAAEILEARGEIEAAVALHQQTLDWENASRLIVTHAPVLCAQGRTGLLLEWIAGIPQDITSRSPWLLYWAGIGKLGLNPISSQRDFSDALSQFETTQNVAGMYLSLAGLFDAIFYAQNDFKQFDPLFEKFELLSATHPDVPTQEIEVRVFSALIRAMLYRYPTDHSQGPAWLQRGMDLWERTADVNLRIQLGFSLGFQFLWYSDVRKGVTMQETLDRLCRNVALEPLCEINLLLMGAFMRCFNGDHERSLEQAARGLELSKQAGVKALNSLLLAVGCYNTLTTGLLSEADRYLEMIGQEVAAGGRNLDTAHYHLLRSWRFMLGGDPLRSHEAASSALELAKQVGAAYPIALCHYGLAHTLVELGRGEEAMHELTLARGTKTMPLIQFCCDALEAAYLFSQDQQAEGLLRLRECLRRSRQAGTPHPLYYRPELMTALYVKALEQDVETAYVRDCIRRSWLIPAAIPSHLDTWPYPVKLHTLGRFAVMRDDKSLPRAPSHKKPLELLQALIALGGREVDEDKLAELFWPEAEGDAARRNLKINVHRLRKLLPEHALVWVEGKLSLDAHQVWVDLWALERELNRLDQMSPVDASAQAALAQRIFSLYRGEFLSGNTAPWALAARERLRHKTLRVIGRVAEAVEDRDPAAAVLIYEKAIEIDPLRESSYQGLMRCYRVLHQPAEVEHVYRRCRDTLKRELGLTPSPATEALHQTLGE